MAFKRKVKVNIHGATFSVVSDLPEKTILSMAQEVENKIMAIEKNVPEASTYMACVMTALSYCQDLRTVELNTEYSPDQMSIYSERIRLAREDADNARLQLITVQEQLQAALNKNNHLVSEAEAARREAKAANILAENAVQKLELSKVEVDSYNLQTEEALDELDKSEEKVAQLSKEIVNKTEQIDQLNNNISELTSQLEQQQAESKATIDELNEKIEKLSEELSKKKKIIFKKPI